MHLFILIMSHLHLPVMTNTVLYKDSVKWSSHLNIIVIKLSQLQPNHTKLVSMAYESAKTAGMLAACTAASDPLSLASAHIPQTKPKTAYVTKLHLSWHLAAKQTSHSQRVHCLGCGTAKLKKQFVNAHWIHSLHTLTGRCSYPIT